MIEIVTYGRTVICSSLTKPSATTCSGATSSPSTSPVAIPAASPTRILREKVMASGLAALLGDRQRRRGPTAM